MEELTNMIVGERIAYIRNGKLIDGKRLSQKKLADVLGCTEQTVIRWEKGETTNIGAEFLLRIANLYGVSVDWLLGLSNIRSTDPDFQSACKTFCLTDEQGIALQDHSGTFAYLLEIMSGYYLLPFSEAIDRFGFCTQLIADTNNNTVTAESDGTIKMPAKQAAYFYAQLAGQILFSALRNQITEEESIDGQP